MRPLFIGSCFNFIGHTFDFITRNGNSTTTYTVRIVPIDGAPWWVGVDLPAALGFTYANLKYDTQNSLGADERRVVKLPGIRGKGVLVISESGLYKLIMRSDKPQARAFQDWVTKEVLPAIRKTGGYVLQGADRATVGEGTVAEMPDPAGVMQAMKAMAEHS